MHGAHVGATVSLSPHFFRYHPSFFVRARGKSHSQAAQFCYGAPVYINPASGDGAFPTLSDFHKMSSALRCSIYFVIVIILSLLMRKAPCPTHRALHWIELL